MRTIFLSFFLTCVLFIGSASAATELTVYTAIEPEMLNRYAQAFQAKHPDITIKWIRDSGGPIIARIIAEKDAPKADVIFGLTLSAVLTLEQYDILEPYISQDLDAIALPMQDHREEPVWTALNAWGAAICLNTKEMEKRKLPTPTTWKDLTKPEYKGLVVMSNPVSSGTALMSVNGWLQSQGDEAAWKFMEELDDNIKMYVHSGCKPCQMVAMGEAVLGIASDACARVLLERKAPLGIVIPADGIGWDIESAALLKRSSQPEAAKKLIDFASSKEVAQIALDYDYIPARADMQTEANKKSLALFLPTDVSVSAKNRDTTLKLWREHFERR